MCTFFFHCLSLELFWNLYFQLFVFRYFSLFVLLLISFGMLVVLYILVMNDLSFYVYPLLSLLV